MAEFFGNGVSRTLNANRRQFGEVVWQKNRPPLDSEFNLVSQVQEETRRLLLQSNTPSGFLTTSGHPKLDYQFESQASNMFWLGGTTQGEIPHALVNGWVVPVTGTLWADDARSAIKLPPPSAPPQESDVNFVFLEVWQALVAANGTVNKPTEDSLWPYGNVEFGGTLLPNDLLDPAILLETSRRVQIQYRIRVVNRTNLAVYPQGFNPSIRAQGPLTDQILTASPLYQFQNMRDELGDAGLWRAGDGNGQTGLLQTVDGYVYAIPICAVFRRGTGTWGVLNGQHDLGQNRNPNMSMRSQASVLPSVTAALALTPTSNTITTNISRVDTTFPASGFVRLGSEVIGYSSWNSTLITVSARGAKGTQASSHAVNTNIDFVTSNPLNLFSDQIVSEDVYDLRPSVNLRGFDHQGLLRHNLDRLLNGQLTSAWKRSEADMKGTLHYQVDYLSQNIPAPNGTLEGDAPDGFRKIFSDAASLQPDNLMVLGLAQTANTSDWSLNPTAQIKRTVALQWNRGDIVRVPLDQYRNTFKSAANQKVRFVHPLEYAGVEHDPSRLWFGDTDAQNPSGLISGQMGYDTVAALGFGRPFTVLGEIPTGLPLPTEGLSGQLTFTAPNRIVITGVDFSQIVVSTGQTAAAYLASINAWIIAGDDAPTTINPANHGAWKIVGTDGGTGLQVENQDGDPPGFTTGLNIRDWYLRLESCTELDTEVFFVLTGVPVVPAPYSTSAAMYLTYDLVYHASQGLARCPEAGLFVRVETPNASVTNYLRELNFADRATATVATVRDFPTNPFSTLPQGTGNTLNPRLTRTLANGPDQTWAESYVDRQSKSLLFQPVRKVQATLLPRNLASVPSYAADINIPEFNLNAGAPTYYLSKDVLPRKGRIDVPFVKARNTLATEAPFGINLLFQLSGGQNGSALSPNPKLMLQRVLVAYNPGSGVPFGDYLPLSAYGGNALTIPALASRRYNKDGISGFELPAHYGIARLFGVYRAPDFYTNGGLGAFAAPLYRDDSGSSIDNLIRTDSDCRSLFISPEGSFVIPDEVVDAAQLDPLLPVPLIFEMAMFVFDTWPDEATSFARVFTTNAVGDPVANTLSLLVNGPATSVDSLFSISLRRPYQGAFVGTMPISTTDSLNLDPVDYVSKKGIETPPQILALLDPLNPDTARQENKASLEILAGEVFCTTLGTGRISGAFIPGSYSDVGYMSTRSYPYTSLTDAPLRVSTRALPITSGGTTENVAMTERLPQGLLTQDCYFMGEGLGPKDASFWMESYRPGPSAIRGRVLATEPALNGVIVVSDGTALGSSALIGYNASFNLYRTYRGGTATGKEGYPISYQGPTIYKDLALSSTPSVKDAAIHGAALFGVALLVRNTVETATASNIPVSYGDELQMVVITGLQIGRDIDPTTLGLRSEFMTLLADVHVTGIGEGYTAVDRYRLEGRPMEKGARNLQTSNVVRRNNGNNPTPIPDPCLCTP